MRILNYGVGPYLPCAEAVRLLQSAAAQGNPDAQCELGVCLRYGRGVRNNENEAKALWREAVAKRSVEAVGHLALSDLDYRRTAPRARLDAAMARWRERAEQGHADAQFCLGLCYYFGVGVTQDDAEAARWFQRSADQGCAVAQSELGVLYHTGTGVAQDKAVAARLYRLGNKIFQMRQLNDIFNVFNRSIWITIANILKQRGVKQHGILRDNAYMAA
mgnify:CR=1 FL=1